MRIASFILIKTDCHFSICNSSILPEFICSIILAREHLMKCNGKEKRERERKGKEKEREKIGKGTKRKLTRKFYLPG